jgi:hypothetical protein
MLELIESQGPASRSRPLHSRAYFPESLGGYLMDSSFGLLWIPAGFFLMVAMVAGLFLVI